MGETVGQALRRMRTSRGLSLRALAAAVTYNHVYIFEIECGRKRPRREIIQACDDHLQAGGQLVAMLDGSDVKRRQFGQAIGAAGMLAILPAVAEPATDAYAGLNAQLWRVFACSPDKSSVTRLVKVQLDMLAAHGNARLLGDLYQLAGEIYFDANRYDKAALCYSEAARASEEAGALDMWACALVRHAFTAIYDRRFVDALPMLDLAAQIAARGDRQLSTLQWVHVVKAQAFAGLGRVADCERSLEIATTVNGLNGPVHNGGWLRFDGSRLDEERGACYVDLQKPELAEPALRAALTQPISPRRRGTVLANLAMVGIQRNDREQAITYAEAAQDIAHRTHSGVVVRKLAGLGLEQG